MTCNVCRTEITEPSEQVPRRYRVKATDRQLPDQFKHAACNDAYKAEKTGLEELLPS